MEGSTRMNAAPFNDGSGKPDELPGSTDERAALLRRIGAGTVEPVERVGKFPLVPVLLAVIVLLMAIVGYLVLSGSGQPEGSGAQPSQVAQDGNTGADEKAPSKASLVAQGYIVAKRRATVSSRQLGVIEAIYVDEGDFVREGQVLGQLDRRDSSLALRAAEAELRVLQAATRSARAQLERERSDLARRSALFEQGHISRADMEAAKARSEVSHAELASALAREQTVREQVGRARLLINDLSIRAPFSGIVIERNAQPGEVLAPSGAGGGFTRTGLCTIVDMKSRQIVVDVSEQMITRVRQGQRVEAELPAYPGLDVSGRVAQITPSADRGRGTVRVRIDLLTDDLRILPDMAVKVRFL
jgi:RND family efflux transporter MFP subunit